MHGNILDANSTNKLINQSVDNKITEGGYVTKNLLDAETARATGVENNLKAALLNYALNSDVEEKLAKKADTTMLSEFIDRTSTEEQAINSPLRAKEYISVFRYTADGASGIKITPLGFFSN